MKNFMLILFGAILVTAIYWGYGKYQVLMKKDDQIKKTASEIPSSAADEVVNPSAENEKGRISGTLGYPAEGIPELTVYAFDTLDETKYFKVETQANQKEFTISDVDPGDYYVVAYAKNYQTSGAYTKAVICGLSVECTDHQMIDVVVGPGKTTVGAAVTDWYAPEGSFPKKP
jgi:hypothetical protein